MHEAETAQARPQLELKRREAYAPWPFHLDAVALEFELDPAETIVTSRLQLRRREGLPADADLELTGRNLGLRSLALDGEALPASRYRIDGNRLLVSGLPAACILEVVTAVAPDKNRAGKGLFFLDGTLVTQMEPEGMSRISYFPDRPDVLSRYRVVMRADRQRFPVLLSNGNRLSQRELPGGRHEAVWEDPWAKPSYIFCIVAGDLAHVAESHATPSGRDVPIRLYAPARYIDRCGFALAAVRRAMAWDEQRYGLECDVEAFQVVALPGFPGAMENKGLNVYDLSGVIADPQITTDDEALTIERIIAHEYFHNWTGNRVTCRDWFQLSLKEGLTRFRDQCYTDELLGAGTYRIETVRTLQRNQFPEDDGPARHPIRPDSYAEVEQLYTATVYEKGAEVIRMMQTLLGEARFMEAVRAYLARFDGQAVTTDDFVDMMAEAGGRDLELFRRWYATPGRPRIRVSRSYDAASRRLRLTLQQLPAVPGAAPMHIPLRYSLVSPSGKAAAGAGGLLELTTDRQEFVLRDVDADTIPSLLEDFSAPVSIEPFLSIEEQLALLRHARDPVARWSAAQAVMVGEIRALARCHHGGEALAVSPLLLETFGVLLARAGDNPMLAADLLRVPDQPALSEGEAEIDVEGMAAGRRAVRAALGRRWKAELLAAVQAPAADGDRALMHVGGMARRRLAGVCLDLLMATGDEDIADLCLQRALDDSDASTMTERFDALSCLADHDCPQRDAALAGFYERWKDHPTVVNKWFSVQALSRAPGALDRIMALQSHPAFDMNNITLVMAFYGSFFRQNREVFHDPTGSGYAWLASLLVMSDRMGRPGGSWLTPQLAQWRRHPPVRREKMRRAIEEMHAADGISNGLRGLCTRLLDQ